MRSNDSNINVKTKKQYSEQNNEIAFSIFQIYITIYHTYLLLYHKGHIQMRSNDSNINVKNNKKKIQ